MLGLYRFKRGKQLLCVSKKCGEMGNKNDTTYKTIGYA